MKTILFATGNEAFENAVMNQLKNMTSEEYKNIGFVLHKETIIPKCNELKPDILIFNDDLDGGTPTLDVVREFKENLSDARLIFITKQRQPGDPVMASVVAYGYYDIIQPTSGNNAISVKKVAELIVNPNNYQAISKYMPNMMTSKDGTELLFDTKIIEGAAMGGSDLNDIDDSTPDLSQSITPLERLDVAREIDDNDIKDISFDDENTRVKETDDFNELSSLDKDPIKFSQGDSLKKLTVLSPMGLNFGAPKPKVAPKKEMPKGSVAPTIEEEIGSDKPAAHSLPKLNLLSESPIASAAPKKDVQNPFPEVQIKKEEERNPYLDDLLGTEDTYINREGEADDIISAIKETSDSFKSVLEKDDLSKKILSENKEKPVEEKELMAHEDMTQKILDNTEEKNVQKEEVKEVRGEKEVAHPQPVRKEEKKEEFPAWLTRPEEYTAAMPKKRKVEEPPFPEEELSEDEMFTPEPATFKTTVAPIEDYSEVEEEEMEEDVVEEVEEVEEKPAKIFDKADFEWNIPGKIFGFIRTNHSSAYTSLNLAYLLAESGKKVAIVDTSKESPLSNFFDNGRMDKKVSKKIARNISYFKSKCVDLEADIKEKNLRERFDIIFVEGIVGHAIDRVLPLLDYRFIQGTDDKFVINMIKERYKDVFENYMLILEPFNDEAHSFRSVSKVYPGKHLTSAISGIARLLNDAYSNKVPVFVEDEDASEEAYAYLMKAITNFSEKGVK